MKSRKLTIVIIGLLVCVLTGQVQAQLILNATESGGDVIITGSGTLNLTALSGVPGGAGYSFVMPSDEAVVSGTSSFVALDHYTGTIASSGPFGTGGFLKSSSGSGDLCGIGTVSASHGVIVPSGYTSGSPLSATSTYSSTSFAALGMVPGTYTWSWGTGANADYIQLNVGASYTLTTSSGSGGSVTTPGEGQNTYAENTVVDLVATPEPGYHFVNWTGSVADVNAASTTITMTAGLTATASFAPNVTITKTPTVIPKALGQNAVWRITVTNTGNDAINNVEVTDVLGDGLEFVSATESGINAGQKTTWTSNEYAALNSMAPSAVLTMDITAKVIATDNVNNVANVRFGTAPSPSGTIFDTESDGGTASVGPYAIKAPDLQLSKSNDGSPVLLGDTWEWELAVTNTGDSSAVFADGDVILTDNLPITNISYSGEAVSDIVNVTNSGNINVSIDGSGVLTCTASGADVTLGETTGAFSIKFTATPTAAGSFDNPVSGGDCEVDPNNVVLESDETNNSASNSVTIQAPDLQLSKSNNGSPVSLGSNWEWKLGVSNTGTAAATFAAGEVILQDDLPISNVLYTASSVSEVTNVTNSGNINVSINGSGLLTCTASGADVTLGATTGAFSIKFTATPSAVGTFANPISSGDCEVDPNDVILESDETNNTATDTVIVQLFPPAVSKSFSPSTVDAGDISTLTFTFNNSASGLQATHLTFTDNLPAGLLIATPANVVNTSFGTVTAVSGTGTISLSGGTVLDGATSTLSVDVVATVGGSYDNISGDVTSILGNSGTMQATLTVNAPEINVKQGSTNIPSSGAYDFQYRCIGQSKDAIMTIQNLGAINLSIATPLNVTGTNADQFSILVQPGTSTIPPGDSTTFTVRFIPTSSGTKTTKIKILNNDLDENPYIIQLAGKSCSGLISGYLFCDANANGTKDENEPGISNVVLFLFNKMDPQPVKVPKALTDVNGYYRFTNVPEGDFVVTIDESSLPDGAVPTTNGFTHDVTLAASEHYKDANFGLGQLDCSEYVGGTGSSQPEIPAGKEANDLVFVEGTQTFGGGDYSWHNAVDGDYEGFDGTTLARGNENPNDPACAVFQFADAGKYKFNYIAFQTDNGTDDDAEKYDYQTLSLEVLVSTTGTEDADFVSVGVFNRKEDGKQLEWHRLVDYVDAKYVKLKLVAPTLYNGNWRQIVEFEVHDGDTKKGASPASLNKMQLTALPETTQLMDAYPNPFNPQTNIEYNLENDSFVSIRVFDLQGREIDSLLKGNQLAGFHNVVWNAQDYTSGTYFIVMQAGQITQTKKVVLLK